MEMSSDDIVLVSGEKLRIGVPIFGYPSPNATWTLDDQPVKDYVKVT